ncbi:MAG: hypothetical protein ACRD2N_25645, partial [Vicinamibacterales bacterium]
MFAGAPRTKRHTKSSQANATPVTNGQRIVAVFGAIGHGLLRHERQTAVEDGARTTNREPRERSTTRIDNHEGDQPRERST